MATLWHVGDLIELICEFDDSATHLTTLRRVSWSFHRAVENVWTLLLGRQNSEIGDEHVDSIAQRYGDSHLRSEQDEHEDIRRVRSVRAALTALRHTLTSFGFPSQWSTELELVAQLVDMPQLQSTKFCGREWLLDLTAQFGTAAQLEALLDRCPHLLSVTPNPAMHRTARSGNLGCALVLLQHGCDVNARDEYGAVIAHIACEHGHHKYLEGLINAGYDVDLSTHCYRYGLPACAAVPYPSTLQFLIARGAVVDAGVFLAGRPRPARRPTVRQSRCALFWPQVPEFHEPRWLGNIQRAWMCWQWPELITTSSGGVVIRLRMAPQATGGWRACEHCISTGRTCSRCQKRARPLNS
jgi:hypothetical protein